MLCIAPSPRFAPRHRLGCPCAETPKISLAEGSNLLDARIESHGPLRSDPNVGHSLSLQPGPIASRQALLLELPPLVMFTTAGGEVPSPAQNLVVIPQPYDLRLHTSPIENPLAKHPVVVCSSGSVATLIATGDLRGYLRVTKTQPA